MNITVLQLANNLLPILAVCLVFVSGTEDFLFLLDQPYGCHVVVSVLVLVFAWSRAPNISAYTESVAMGIGVIYGRHYCTNEIV